MESGGQHEGHELTGKLGVIGGVQDTGDFDLHVMAFLERGGGAGRKRQRPQITFRDFEDHEDFEDFDDYNEYDAGE